MGPDQIPATDQRADRRGCGQRPAGRDDRPRTNISPSSGSKDWPRVRPKGNPAPHYWPNRSRAPSLLQGAVQTAQIHRLERGVDSHVADQTGAFLRSPAAFPLSRDTSRSSRQDRLLTLADTVNHSPDVRNGMSMASFRVVPYCFNVGRGMVGAHDRTDARLELEQAGRDD